MKRCNWRVSLRLVLAWFLFTPFVLAQQHRQPTDDLKKDIETVKEGIKALQRDVQEIKALLQSRQPAVPLQNVELEIGKSPFKGERAANVTLVEFSDYQCPYCAKHARETSPQIEKAYVETGKLKYVFVDYPLESIHKLAFKAAEAARCAGDQGKYWEMHDRLFANQESLEPWTEHARALGLDVSKFDGCLTTGKYVESIREDLAQGQKVAVTGTPVYFLAYTDPTSSKVKTVVRFAGARPFTTFKAEIEKLLARQSKKAQAEATQKPK